MRIYTPDDWKRLAEDQKIHQAIRFTRFRALLLALEQGPRRTREIEESKSARKGTTARLEALVRRGLVEVRRVPLPAKYQLTELGRRAAKMIRAESASEQRESARANDPR